MTQKNIEVSASVLCADFSKLGQEVRRCEEAGVDRIHIDVMDGMFVPNITIGGVVVKAIREMTQLPIESHLMIEEPHRYIEDFAKAGTDIFMIHAECYGQRRADCLAYDAYPKEIDEINEALFIEDVKLIRSLEKKAYIVLNPGTPLCLSAKTLAVVDGVLLMSVNPGFAHQSFISDVLPKAFELRQQGYEGDIAIDGGINAETAVAAVESGVNVLATASYLFNSQDISEAVSGLKSK